MPAATPHGAVPATRVSRRTDLREMAATDDGASSSATPAWPGTVSRRLNGVWRLHTPPASGSSVVPPTLQICFRNVGEGSGARTTELAVLASGQRLESVDLERGDALVARTPDLRALLVVGPTTLSSRQTQNERLCSFGETRASTSSRERVMFAFQFSNLDDAERCFDVLRPWLSATAPGASETRTSLRAMLGISPEPATRTTPRDGNPGGTRDAHPEVFERPGVPSEAATRAELMTTAEVMAMMETVTVSANAGGDASGDARATADADAAAAADAEPEPETRAKTTETETRETQTSILDPDDPDDDPVRDLDARSEVEPWRWSSGVPPDVPDDTARARVREMLRGCLAPGVQAVSGGAAAFARAPLGAGMPFDRYARLVGEAMDEMIRTGDIVVEGARGKSDDDENDSLDDDADDERDGEDS